MSDKESYDGRTGLGQMLKLEGMNKSKDTASLADNEHAHLENVRVKGGRIVSRGGQIKVDNTALDGCVESIVDGGPFGLTGLILFGNNGSANQAESIRRYNNGTLTLLEAEDFGRIITSMRDGNSIYAVTGAQNDNDDPTIRQLSFNRNKVDQIILAALADTEDDTTFGAVAKFDGAIFVTAFMDNFIGGGEDECRVYRFYRNALTLDRTGAGLFAGQFANWLIVRGSELICVLDGWGSGPLDPHALHRRAIGGVWTTVATPAGYGLNFGIASSLRQLPAIYAGDLFMGGLHAPNAEAVVLRYNGTTIAVSNEIAGTTGQLEALVVWPATNVLLAFRRRTSDDRLFIDSYNGTAWTNAVHDFGTGENSVVSAVVWNNTLFALMGSKLKATTTPPTGWVDVAIDVSAGFFTALALDVDTADS